MKPVGNACVGVSSRRAEGAPGRGAESTAGGDSGGEQLWTWRAASPAAALPTRLQSGQRTQVSRVTESVREKLSSLLVGKQRKEHGSCVHGSFSRKSRKAGGWLCPTHPHPLLYKTNKLCFSHFRLFRLILMDCFNSKDETVKILPPGPCSPVGAKACQQRALVHA